MLPVSAKLLWHLAPLTSLYSLKDPLPSRTWHNCPPKSHQPCSWLCCPKPLHSAVEASSRKTELLSEERETLIRDRGDQKLLSHRLYHACCQGLEKGILCQREKWEERNNFCLPKEKRLVSSHPSYFFFPYKYFYLWWLRLLWCLASLWAYSSLPARMDTLCAVGYGVTVI